MVSGPYTDPLQRRNSGITGETQDAKLQASAIWNDTKDGARTLLGQQQKSAASALGDVARALRKAAHELGDEQREAPVSRFLDSAAGGLERFSGSLQDKDFNELLHDAEALARRQPVVFFGAALAVGFLAARFLKSSKPTRIESRHP